MSHRPASISVFLLAGVLAGVAMPLRADQLAVTRKANGTWVISDSGGPRRSGMLYRDDASWLITQRDRPLEWDPIIQSTAREFGVDPMLVKCMMLVESGYNPRAVSSKGARGLMQLMPATGRAYGVRDFFDPEQNIRGGVRYLNFLLNLFNGNLNLAIAGYNAGEGAVARYGAIPPYDETQDYVRKVLTAYNASPFLTGGKFKTSRYTKIDVDRDPARPIFAWFDPSTSRRVISVRRPPSSSTLKIRRLVRGR